MKKAILLSSLFVLALSGCAKPITPPEPILNDPISQNNPKIQSNISDELKAQSKITKFENQEELLTFLEESDLSDDSYQSYELRTFDGGMAVEEGLAMPDMVSTEAPMAKSLDAQVSSDDYSQTNVQVEGVDEADIIKNDGKYIYALVKNNLYIINAYPTDKVEILSKIEFKSRPQDIYINNDRLIVFGADNNIRDIDLYKTFRRRNNFTFFKVFDINDRKNPVQVKDLDFEGGYTNSRMIGDYVYFVTTAYNYYYIQDEPLLPRILENGVDIANNCKDVDKCFNPDIYYFDIPYDNYNFTNIYAINVANESEDITGETYILSYSQNMYVSQDNIYITYTKYVSEYEIRMEIAKEVVFPKLSSKDQDKIINIENAENYILSKSEKRRKIETIIERYASSLTNEQQDALEKTIDEKVDQKYEDLSKELEKTVIHKINIDKNKIEYDTFGEVAGHVLNQFSMDEDNGYFRIATTKNRTWSRYMEEDQESYNNIYVLDNNLKVVGEVEDLAKGERIYSVRFMQDRAYMVTFKQVDPLFVVDLSNPKKPTVLGELKIPGFSNYLHPYDENLLIGLGKDTSTNEWGGVSTKGIKLSLFDVSDVSNPKEVDTYVLGDAGSDSIALNDHKAFLFSKDKNLLSIPVSLRESTDDNRWGKLTFSGAAVFNVTEEGFDLVGKIDHSDGGRDSDTDYWRGYSYYDNTVQRSLYIDDVLYTFSNKYIKMNKINNLDSVGSLELKKERKTENNDFDIIN